MEARRTFKNIGPVSEAWLRAIGVHTRADLEALGAVETYRLVQQHGFRPSLNLLHALEGAIRDVPWTALPERVKAKLKRETQARSKE
jgi:hypothetical protein